MPVTDRFGMALSTESTAAAEWQYGVDKLLSQNHGPELHFIRAIELDEGFAMAHCGLAVWYQQKARPEDAKERFESCTGSGLRSQPAGAAAD